VAEKYLWALVIGGWDALVLLAWLHGGAEAARKSWGISSIGTLIAVIGTLMVLTP
jgi:hypothetical protein